MNRAGFFQAIVGGAAAIFGFKPVEGFRYAKGVFVKPKSMGRIIKYSTAPIADKEYEELLRGEVPESHAEQIKKDRLKIAMDLETNMMNEDRLKIINFYSGKK